VPPGDYLEQKESLTDHAALDTRAIWWSSPPSPRSDVEMKNGHWPPPQGQCPEATPVPECGPVYTKPEAITAQRFPQVAFAVIARSEATTQSIPVASTLWIAPLRALSHYGWQHCHEKDAGNGNNDWEISKHEMSHLITEGEAADGRGLSTSSDLRRKSGLTPPRMLRRRLEARDGCQACKWPA